MADYGAHLANRLDQANGRIADFEKEIKRLMEENAQLRAVIKKIEENGFVVHAEPVNGVVDTRIVVRALTAK